MRAAGCPAGRAGLMRRQRRGGRRAVPPAARRRRWRGGRCGAAGRRRREPPLAAGWRGCGGRAFQHRDQVTGVDLVAQLDLEFLDHAGRGRRNLHRGLVGLDGEQRLLDLDRVARLDQQLDDGHVLEVADVRHPHFDRAGCAAGAAARGRRLELQPWAFEPSPCAGEGWGGGEPACARGRGCRWCFQAPPGRTLPSPCRRA